MDIADCREQCRRAFRSDSFNGFQILEAVHLTAMILNRLIQFFNALIQAANLFDDHEQFRVGDWVKVKAQSFPKPGLRGLLLSLQNNEIGGQQIVDLVFQDGTQLNQLFPGLRQT